MKMKSIARSPFKYAGALVQPKEEFSVKSARDIKVLTVMKRAALLSPPVKVEAEVKRTYKRRDMVAESAIPSSTTGVVVLTESDPVADMKGKTRRDNPGRSSWAEKEKL